MKQYPFNNPDYYSTFSEMVSGIEKFAEKPAIEWFDRQKERYVHDYKRFCSDVNALKKALISRALNGKHVAIVGENSYHWILAFLAITSTGGVAVCVDTEQPDEIIRQLICQADTQVVFATTTFYPICQPLFAEDKVSSIVVMSSESGSEAPLSLDGLIEEGRKLPEPEYPPVSPDDTAAIIFTSGTTSKSKPVMLTHRNLLQNASSSLASVDIKNHTYTALPFYHSYGLTCAILNSLINGSKLTINGDIKTMMRDLLLSNPENFTAVPLMVEALHGMLWVSIEKSGDGERVRAALKRYLKMKSFGLSVGKSRLVAIKEKIFGRVNLIISGGAHLNPEISRALEAFGILVVQGYGISECSPLISVNRNKTSRFETVGHVLRGCEVKIVNDEIWVKGPNVMKGYYKDPEATTEVFEGEWFKTGDLGSIDKNGYLSITGRIKNLIVLKNGKKISPEKIEELIQKIPLVKDVMVYGATNGTSADDVKPAASIYPDPAKAEGMTSYEILDHLQKEINIINATLPPYQQIQMVNIREKEFLKTASKKIKRYAV